jgi:hypothetical protein
MRKCANISPYMRRPLVIYDFATAPLKISLYMRKIYFLFYQCTLGLYITLGRRKCVLLPENLRAYFELSAQAWILYKAPQWNTRYPNSCPERIKLKMHWGCGPRPLFAGLIQRRWTPWSKPKHGFDNYHNKDNSQHHFVKNNFQIIRQQLNRLLNALQTY